MWITSAMEKISYYMFKYGNAPLEMSYFKCSAGHAVHVIAIGDILK